MFRADTQPGEAGVFCFIAKNNPSNLSFDRRHFLGVVIIMEA